MAWRLLGVVVGSWATEWIVRQDLAKLLLPFFFDVTFAIRIKELLLSLLPWLLLAAAAGTTTIDAVLL